MMNLSRSISLRAGIFGLAAITAASLAIASGASSLTQAQAPSFEGTWRLVKAPASCRAQFRTLVIRREAGAYVALVPRGEWITSREGMLRLNPVGGGAALRVAKRSGTDAERLIRLTPDGRGLTVRYGPLAGSRRAAGTEGMVALYRRVAGPRAHT